VSVPFSHGYIFTLLGKNLIFWLFSKPSSYYLESYIEVSLQEKEIRFAVLPKAHDI